MVNQRRKGHQFERDIANKFSKLYPGARRKLEYHLSDCTGVDIILPNSPFKIQCKNYQKYAPLNKIEEIKEPGIKLLITKGKNLKPMVGLYLDDFLNILEDIGVVYEKEKDC